MRVALLWTSVAVAAVALVAGCGGSNSETVGDCVIESGTSCPDVDLTDADLEGADLSGAVLTSATLAGANLSEANLTDADLSGAQITDADLSDADLTRTNLTGATITGTNLEGATLCGTTRTDGTIDDTSCPASTDETETDTDTTLATATVSSLELSELDCATATTGQVTVTWETDDATAVGITLDTSPVATGGPSGETTITVPCDSQPHAVTVTPQSDAGQGVPDTEQVSTSG